MTFTGKVSDVPAGTLLAVKVDGKPVAVASLDGQLFAVSDICTHRGCSLAEGELKGSAVVCPCHRSEFDMKNGEVLAGPAREPVAVYPVQVSGDEFTISSTS